MDLDRNSKICILAIYGTELVKQNKNWPAGVQKNIVFPKQTLPENLLASAQRVPLRKALIFYGAEYTYQEVLQLVERLSGYLQSVIQIKPDEPVLLYMQNSPQFIISFYAILHAGGVVIPVNPMSRINGQTTLRIQSAIPVVFFTIFIKRSNIFFPSFFHTKIYIQF